ncbi:MAG: hypothetical protein JO316_21820 [Abitibacteriaceae bacterium]|nr:hypothetical protein [Abditibacteriaceae bacterium]MBV9868003.1 hypothetical protein [Abditibacteriaceae bacterium]
MITKSTARYTDSFFIFESHLSGYPPPNLIGHNKNMKKFEAVLMMVPVAALAWLGLLSYQGGPLLRLGQAQVLPLTPAAVKQTSCADADTEVRLTLHYNSLNLYKRWLTGPSYRDAECDCFLVDQHGRIYRKFKTWYNPGTNDYPMWCYAYGVGQAVRVGYRFPLHNIPRAAGRILLKGKLSVDYGFKLPIAVLVRYS